MYVLFYVGFGLDRFLGLKRSLVFVWRLRLRGFDFTYHLMIHPGVWCVTWNMIYSGCYFYFSFHLILVYPKRFWEIHLSVPISSVLHLERKEKKYLWIYLDVWIWKRYMERNVLFFVSFTFLFVCFFRCFSSCWKNSSFDPLFDQLFFILYSSASSNLYLFFCFSLSHWKSIVHKYTRAKQFQFFFSLSLSLSLKQFFQFLPTLESISIQYYFFSHYTRDIYSYVVLVNRVKSSWLF